MFDRFFQTKRIRSARVSLELFIAKSIVEAHGGKIWTESRARQHLLFHLGRRGLAGVGASCASKWG
ncbi:MAG: hypothetical protein ABI704_04065 [Kofleriaceae bacterium]